jgi:hypothetical protein
MNPKRPHQRKLREKKQRSLYRRGKKKNSRHGVIGESGPPNQICTTTTSYESTRMSLTIVTENSFINFSFDENYLFFF